MIATSRTGFIRRFSLIALTGLMLLVCMMGLLTPKVSAAASTCLPDGIPCWQGYFYNGTALSGGNVISGGLFPNNGNDFVNEIGGALRCGAYPNDQNAVGASFIVDTMLGIPAFGGDGAKLAACARFGEWANKVHEYENAGLVNWNVMHAYSINTFYQRAQNDDAFFPENGSDPSIVFSNPGGGTAYAIRRECGNPIGVITPLQDLGWTFDEWSGANKASVYPGDSVTFTDWAHNNGPATGFTQYYDENQFNKFGVPTTGWNVGVWHDVTAFANGETKAYNDTVNVPVTDSTQVCNHSVTFWDSSYNPGRWGVNGGRPPVCVTINQPQPACVGPTYSPASLETTVPFSVTTSVNYNDGAAGFNSARNTGGTYYMTVKDATTGAPLAGGVTMVPNGAGWTERINFPAQATPAKYTVNWGVAGGSGAKDCGSYTFLVASYPFFQVHGGDVVTGASFSTTPATPCSSALHNGDAGISTWNKGSAGGYSGAGGDYAAIAMDYIQGFVSDTTQGGAGVDMSFANSPQNGGSGTTPGGLDLFGGLFGGPARSTGVQNCVDYWNTKPSLASLAPVPGGASTTLNNAMDGPYQRVGNLIINGGTVGNGKHVTMYVDGDVHITAPITYQSTAWGSVTDIQSFKLIVHGAIYIDAHVDQLDGTYVAVPDHYAPGDPVTTANNFSALQKGTISTCSIPGSSPFRSYDPSNAAANGMISACNSQLVVNGSFVANQVFLARTNGTVSDGSNPGEVFNYSPETWLSGSSTLNNQAGSYQSVVGLPPVL